MPTLITDIAQREADRVQALKQFRAMSSTYRKYSNYYAGNHPLNFATEKFNNAFGSLFQEQSDNLCATVVDALTDKLIITGFGQEDELPLPSEAPDVPPAPSEVQTIGQGAAEAWEIWEANRMDQRASEVHSEASKCGDAYVIVWPDPETEEPVIYPQEAHQTTVRYDPERPGRLLWAAKLWPDEAQRLRLNMYYPDRIEKYVTTKGKYSTDTTWSIPDKVVAFTPWLEGGWPDGIEPNQYEQVPVFHFANNAPIGKFGRSELKDVLPIQDALNKSVCDMLVAMEVRALGERWATGIEVARDPVTKEPINPFKSGLESIWVSANKEARFGEFAQADLTQFVTVQENHRKEIGVVSRTPIHMLQPPTGAWPSGESLKTAESPFVAKVERRMIAFGNVWEDVMKFALLVAGKALAEDDRLSTQWADPTPRNDREQVEIGVQKKEKLGIPVEVVWKEQGYSNTQIAAMSARKEAARAAMPAPMQAQMAVPTQPPMQNGASQPEGVEV